MTIKGGTSQACAACKYQRRKCSSECPLAPFFPPDKPKMFQNAHRLFGVCNIMKILKQLDDNQKEEAMRSIIYESEMREHNPVHGCWGIICSLHQQLQQATEELHYVQTRIALFKEQIQEQVLSSIPSQHCSASSQLQLGMMPTGNNNNGVPVCHSQYHGNGLMPNQFFNGAAPVENGIDNMVKPNLWANHPYYNNNGMGMQNQLVSQAFPLQQETEVSQDYDDIPFDTIADDRQSYIDLKEACESSAESPMKDTTQSIEHVSQNDLKNAAACFSLTSVN